MQNVRKEYTITKIINSRGNNRPETSKSQMGDTFITLVDSVGAPFLADYIQIEAVSSSSSDEIVGWYAMTFSGLSLGAGDETAQAIYGTATGTVSGTCAVAGLATKPLLIELPVNQSVSSLEMAHGLRHSSDGTGTDQDFLIAITYGNTKIDNAIRANQQPEGE